MTVERLEQETDLAWALAEAAKPYLSTVERNDVFAAIGAGETFAAIRQLFESVAMKRIPLRPDLVKRCITWLRAHVGHEEERYLRRLIEDFVIPNVIRAPATVRVNGVPTIPSPVSWLRLPATERCRAVKATVIGLHPADGPQC